MNIKEFETIPSSGTFKVKFKWAGDYEFLNGNILCDVEYDTVMIRGDWYSQDFIISASWVGHSIVNHKDIEYIQYLDMEVGCL